MIQSDWLGITAKMTKQARIDRQTTIRKIEDRLYGRIYRRIYATILVISTEVRAIAASHHSAVTARYNHSAGIARNSQFVQCVLLSRRL